MTTNKPQFVYVTYISTTPEKVWSALTDGELTRLYWGQHKNVSTWEKGSPWSHQDYESGVPRVEGEVLESERPSRLVLSWRGADEAAKNDKPSRVTFLIEPFMDAVRLTVTHEELEPGSKTEKGISAGWPAILSSLKTLLETGKPMAMSAQRWGGPPK